MGRHIKLQQGSDEWKEWRSTRWMASEAGCIMGVNPRWMEVKTWEDLRMAKAGFSEPSEFALKAFAWGHENEPAARERFMVEHSPLPAEGFGHGVGLYLWKPACVESRMHTKLAASLDGLEIDERNREKHILELKCPMRDTSKLLKVKKWADIPAQYRWQMLHQFIATDWEQATMHFYAKHPKAGEPGAYVKRVFDAGRDGEDIAALLYCWERFEAGEDGA